MEQHFKCAQGRLKPRSRLLPDSALARWFFNQLCRTCIVVLNIVLLSDKKCLVVVNFQCYHVIVSSEIRS